MALASLRNADVANFLEQLEVELARASGCGEGIEVERRDSRLRDLTGNHPVEKLFAEHVSECVRDADEDVDGLLVHSREILLDAPELQRLVLEHEPRDA